MATINKIYSHRTNSPPSTMTQPYKVLITTSPRLIQARNCMCQRSHILSNPPSDQPEQTIFPPLKQAFQNTGGAATIESTHWVRHLPPLPTPPTVSSVGRGRDRGAAQPGDRVGYLT
jgi:hypothetical protein